MAYGNQSIDQYRKAAVSTASPLQLVIMLYDGALRFMQQGKAAMASGDLQEHNDKLQKAQKIIAELTSCLDMDQGGEIAQNLFALYDFAYNRLVTANVEDRPDCIDQAMKVLSELRESWVQVEGQQRAEEIQRHAA
ncbi:MAG: flagellar export chaperone FliS [Armatimonadota bacterium]